MFSFRNPQYHFLQGFPPLLLVWLYTYQYDPWNTNQNLKCESPPASALLHESPTIRRVGPVYFWPTSLQSVNQLLILSTEVGTRSLLYSDEYYIKYKLYYYRRYTTSGWNTVHVCNRYWKRGLETLSTIRREFLDLLIWSNVSIKYDDYFPSGP